MRGRTADLTGSRIPLAVLQSPFQFCIALISSVVGLGVFASTIFGALPTFTAVQAEIPSAVTLAWGGSLILGGVGVAAAMLARAVYPSAVYAEAVLLPSLATGWVVYAIGLALGIGVAGFVPILVGVLIAVACALRIRAIVLAHTLTRKVATIREETS